MVNQRKRKIVYNLEFPDYCSELSIFGYKFLRAEGYEEKVKQLQHLVSVISEIHIEANSGGHAPTAVVEIPENEEKTALEWEGDHTALQDILLLLSLFTGREVFVLDEATQGTIVLDPRTYQWGGSLRVAIPYKGERLKDLEESIIQVEKTDEAGNSTFMELDLYPWQCDTGLEEELNRIYELIRIPNWQKKYGKGYFLFLARTAFRRQTLEASFIQCWTIWEHLFALHTSSWFPEKEIQRFSAQYKIAYLLVEYSLKNEIKSEGQRSIETLVSVRNRLIHYGRFPESGAGHNEAVLFIRLTEFIIAKIFQLSPSNLFNTVERLEEFLNGQLSKQ